MNSKTKMRMKYLGFNSPKKQGNHYHIWFPNTDEDYAKTLQKFGETLEEDTVVLVCPSYIVYSEENWAKLLHDIYYSRPSHIHISFPEMKWNYYDPDHLPHYEE